LVAQNIIKEKERQVITRKGQDRLPTLWTPADKYIYALFSFESADRKGGADLLPSGLTKPLKAYLRELLGDTPGILLFLECRWVFRDSPPKKRYVLYLAVSQLWADSWAFTRPRTRRLLRGDGQ
jgi:hypothetical protein